MVLWLCESLVLFGVCCSLQKLVWLWSFARLADLGNRLSNLLLTFRRFHRSVASWLGQSYIKGVVEYYRGELV